jgi:hypothetical protein
MGGTCSRVRKLRNVYKILVAKSEGKPYLENIRVDGRMILNWILKKKNDDDMAWIHSI